MAAGGEHVGDALLGETVGDRPDTLAVQIDVDDGDVEAPLLDPRQRVGQSLAGGGDPVAEGFEEILEHHRDERLVLDDQHGTGEGGPGVRLRRSKRWRNHYLAARRLGTVTFPTGGSKPRAGVRKSDCPLPPTS